MILPAHIACSSGSKGPLPQSPISEPLPDSVTIRASLRDLGPSVRFAASQNEMAVVHRTRPEPGVRHYQMLTVRDEPALLIVRLPDSAIQPDDVDDPGSALSKTNFERLPFFPRTRRLAIELDPTPHDMTASISVGHLGDPRRERAFLRDMRSRLRALEKAGGTAPLPEN